jgi:hypothetical protein
MAKLTSNGHERQAKIVDAVNAWQSSGVVHPLTCGNNSRHRPLVPKEEGDRDVVLVCLDCDYRQTNIPGVVTRTPPKTLSDVVVPASPFDFEETVRRVLKVKPPAKKGAKKR